MNLELLTTEEENELHKFLNWLYERSQRDQEDIHDLQFSTNSCKLLYNAIINLS